MRKIYLFAALVYCLSGELAAQTQEISGQVTETISGEPIPFANIVARQKEKIVSSTTTDITGHYVLKLDPGEYDITLSSMGFGTVTYTAVSVSSNKTTTLDMKTKEGIEIIWTTIRGDQPSVLNDETSVVTVIDPKEIAESPMTDITGIIKTTVGVTQSGDGRTLHFFGGRGDASEVYIDNVRVIGSFNIPVSAIQEIKIYNLGVPAQFGDATSSVIAIVTKGPSGDFGGTVDISSSKGMDAYGLIRGTANLTGPIVVKNKGKDDERVALGYFVAVEGLHHDDASPSAVGTYKVKDDVLNYLEANPLVPSPISDVFIPATETITMEDLERVHTKPNVAENSYSLSGKLEAKPTQFINIAVGGNYIRTARHDWIDRYSLFNYENNPLYNENTYRVYGRYRQRFSSKDTTGGKKPTVPRWEVQNAYYQVQFDYTKVRNTYSDDSHGFDPFHYGHLGSFDVLKGPSYVFGFDEVSGKTGWKLAGYRDTLTRFAPSVLNPTGTAYTRRYYELAGGSLQDGWWTAPVSGAQQGFYESLDQIQLNGGLRNGDRPRLAHDIWFNTGRQFSGYGINNDNDRYALNLLGAVDIRKAGNKHSLEFGFEFEQRVERNYQVSAIGLWELMRQLANKHIDQLDFSNPYLLIDGELYDPDDPNAPAFSMNDTIHYNRLYAEGNQSFFDRSLRRKLMLADDNTDFINTDSYAPDFYSLDMFSADELLNNGNPYVGYAGYDYLGNRLKKQPTFEDYFKERDAHGNFTRAIGAYRPIYSAAFIQDEFNFKDLRFNVGLRVDRFDANQKVLRDPYTLYRAYTVGEAADRLEGTVPANIGNSYVVYVDDLVKDNPVPLGYRNGDTWYTTDGTETNDPKIIAQSSSTGRITPFLVNPNDNIKSPDYNPHSSFKDYDPQITVMPRISFEFQLKEKVNFFAHYNIMTQRPQGGIFTTPDVWYFFNENIGSIINNPALKPENTIDYQLGFEQGIGRSMAFTLSAYYREMRDMVQVVNVPYAYPRDYKTFGNVDFGTVKGFSIAYEMQKDTNTNFSVNFNYTIQFAEGTGSNSTSQANLIGSGQPNLRTIAPLDFDSRHNINLTLGYSYDDDDLKPYNGPVTKSGHRIFANSGITVMARANSGSPYTQQNNATAEALSSQASRKILSGSINGSHMPWNFRMDMRIWKEFNLTASRSKEDDAGKVSQTKRKYSLNVYFLVQNLLGTANVVSVYPYTGNAADDGYLTSEVGKQDVAGRANAESYQDQYRAYLESGMNGASGSRYSAPRQMRVGAIFKF